MRGLNMAPGLTPEQAVEERKRTAPDSLANSMMPILFMDEWCATETDTAYALGWNSICVCEEDEDRFAALDRIQHRMQGKSA